MDAQSGLSFNSKPWDLTCTAYISPPLDASLPMISTLFTVISGGVMPIIVTHGHAIWESLGEVYLLPNVGNGRLPWNPSKEPLLGNNWSGANFKLEPHCNLWVWLINPIGVNHSVNTLRQPFSYAKQTTTFSFYGTLPFPLFLKTVQSHSLLNLAI